MGLTYDGITYRSLEEQVRYDAEQIQLLKQADVTINENLQTVNENLQTEINGKLTKPTNPSAESAVTMLADGTVGTKPLSEIGGGKLYLHRLSFSAKHPNLNTGSEIPILVERYSSNRDTLTFSNFQTLFPINKVVLGTVYVSSGCWICAIRCIPTGEILSAVLYCSSTEPDATKKEGSGLVFGVELTRITVSTDPPAYPIRFSSDTVIEL